MKRIFYDGKNTFCKRAMKKIKKHDTSNQFTISSLDGKKAKMVFSGNYAFLRRKRNIVFIEGQRVWVKANALMRIYWLLGGPRKIVGALFVLPGFLINPFYHLCTFLFWR